MGGLHEIQIVKVNVCHIPYLGKVFENLTSKVQSFQRLKNLWCFRVFVLSLEPIQKDRKFRNTKFRGKLVNEIVFSWVKTGHLH